jgi:uncharacterized protein with ParB-like and HNH nuclease domain
MEGQLFSLSKIFTERILRIPDYQRGYAWTDKQLKEFWADLLQLDEGKNHYTGVLTLENVPERNFSKWTDDLWIIQYKGYTPYYVVDGQQRLTTSIILIQAISEYIPNDKKLNFTDVTKIREKFIFESKDESISRSYIFGYEKDNLRYYERGISSQSTKGRFITRDMLLILAFRLNKGKVDIEKVIKEIENVLNAQWWKEDLIKLLIKDFGSGGFYFWEGIRYFLYEYEEELRSKGKNYTQKIDWQEFTKKDSRDFISVEHIYPQKAKKDCWKKTFNNYSLAERKILMNALGNLVPLSRPKNSSLQNNCFEDKKGSKEKKVGFRYGSYSEIDVSNHNDWTPKEILIRSIELLNFLESKWGVSLGNVEEKIDLLKLRFVLHKEMLNLSELESFSKPKGKKKLSIT